MHNTRPRFLITVHSHKGGTGKTTLALLLQCALARRKAGALSSVVIDLDLTGTTPAGAVLLQAFPSGGDHRLTAEDTQRVADRGERWWESDIAYINYWLLSPPPVEGNRHSKFLLRDYVWAPNDGPNVECGIVPSSRHPEDIREALEAVHYDNATELLTMQIEDFVRRVLGLQTGRGRPSEGGVKPFDAVIIDTSPTLCGSSRIAYSLHRILRVVVDTRLEPRADNPASVRHIAVHVMSPDIQCVKADMAAFRDLEKEIPASEHKPIVKTVHVINMILRDDIPELGFEDRSNVIKYYSSQIQEPPSDKAWGLVRWDRELLKSSIQPRSMPQVWQALLSRKVAGDVDDVVERILSEVDGHAQA